MKRQTFRIHMQYPFDGRREWREIQGYSVVIPGFEEFKLFVHRPTCWLFNEGWHISEESTGFGLSSELDALTREKAIYNATVFLQGKGKDKFINALNKAREIIVG